MSIWTSLFTGSSGLGAHGDAISVVGDNIANVSTIGYKSSRADFADVIGGTAANGQRLGQGVRMSGVETYLGQGTLQQTGRSLDLAIRGNGFFVLNGNHDGAAGNYYSRDGQFSLDNTGTVVNAEGLKLQGYVIDPTTGQTATTLSDLTIGGTSPPKATTKVDMSANLSSSDPVLATPFDPANPSSPTSSSYSTSMTAYDSLGNSHKINLYFRNNGAGGWDYHAMVDGGEVGGTKGTPTEIGNGTLTFDAKGALVSQTGTTTASFTGATAGQVIAFNFGDPTSTGGTGTAGSTQYASTSLGDVKSVQQDGWSSGVLTDVSVGDDGTVSGKFSNGQSRPIAQVALASFTSPTNLHRAGSQDFTETQASGQALIGAAGSGSRGAISGGALEGSNVDLSSELVSLIAYQRAFSANSKTVSTADEMLQDVVNLKR